MADCIILNRAEDTQAIELALGTNELLIAMINELQITNLHLAKTTDQDFNVNDIDDGHNL